MPRRNRHDSSTGARPLSGGLGDARTESGPDGDWIVRSVPGSQTTKTYRCPGCDHEVRPGTAHLVAWPADELGSAADRRHWHSGCWQARGRRGPTRRW
ncbi:hypothetical protein JOF53_005694 [Crossiella equi]|uniref:ATP/GTP-binding protein n=1 Tax=Crossiella equi TaxID=130796 RepID=A0ABS5AKN4_9PSEU|nr:hypothetical protein [Crossiella equi]MBP2476822.1 hypothetical protein [Crossiella equi]